MFKMGYDKEQNILFMKSSGKRRVEDVIAEILAIDEDKSLPRNLKILLDITESTMEFSMEETKLIFKSAEYLCENFDSIRHAFIINKPMDTAKVMHINQGITNKKYIVNIFSTKDSAIHWLNL